jgi:monofunctional biosynthetic peptidoglycan transglycosylase
MARRRFTLWRGRGWLTRIGLILFVVLVAAPAALLLVFRFVPIPATPQMLLSAIEGKGARHQWVDDISPRLARAVIAAEDQNFCRHHGFDWGAIDKAVKEHERHPRAPMRGASTISQQTARTLFLTPARNWVRKGVEAWLTVMIEALWPKKRIMAAYLNLVDWGNGIFGAQAAAKAYFGTNAADLTASEAARLAAILPNPHEWRARNPGPYVARRAATLRGRSAAVVRDGLTACLR